MSENRTILSISQLNENIKNLLESNIQTIWLDGEISNFSAPHSGHFYFSLKDDRAQVRCAMFRGFNRYLKIKPENGQQVLVKAKATLYAPRGDYQLIVEYMEAAGDGRLHQQYEATKAQLEKAGYFNSKLKKMLPKFPKKIGVITSATGAAIRDILVTLNKNYPIAQVIVYPCQVQGRNASLDIVQAIALANQHQAVDVLILGRGGGSLEDLWCFNEVAVATAIHQSKLPIITGIGHETDHTIADFVADLRAATPTAAAQASCPDILEIKNQLHQFQQSLCAQIRTKLQEQQTQIQLLQRSLTHPLQIIHLHAQKIDNLEQKIIHRFHYRIKLFQDRLALAQNKINKQSPLHALHEKKHHVRLLEEKLIQTMSKRLHHAKQNLSKILAMLDNLSPLSTLSRGYAIVQSNQNIIHSAAQVSAGDSLRVTLNEGQLICLVKQTSTAIDNTSPVKEISTS